MYRLPTSVLASVALAAALLTGVVSPLPSAASTTPPACAYGSRLTPQRSVSQWQTSLLDTTYMFPSGYYPGDLVSTSTAGLNGGYNVRRLVITDLKAMAAAAKAARAPLAIQSAFRSYATQASTFAYWVRVDGTARALATSARAGHSEHQLGTVIDFRSSGGSAPWNYADWGTTAAGKWLAANAYAYGFVMSYPKGNQATTCYAYEPWHYRYVGRTEARAIHDSHLTARAWLWRAGSARVAVTATFAPVRSVSFLAGTYTGMKFDGLGAVVATKAASLSRASGASASRRIRVYGRSYVFIINGIWAGYYMPQSTGVTVS